MSRRRQVLLGAIAALAVLLGASAFAGRIGGADPAGTGVAQNQLGPVLLISGYGGQTGAVDELAAALRSLGRDATVVPVVGDGTGDLRDQARSLQATADEALADGAPSVDIVGFSAGGLVARVWADELGGAAVARRIVTLGSPHHGAEVAALGVQLGSDACREGCRQLAPGSELLDGLDETPDGPRWTSIWSTDDEVVTPPDSARLDGAVNVVLQDVCPGTAIQHGALPRHPLPRGIVVLAIGVEPLESAPESSRCAEVRAAGMLAAAA